MPNTILKRWNGSAFEELYPKTTVTQISASGTPSSSTFLRGDGQWITPAGSGDVVGPASATSGSVATFNGTTGKLIQNGGVLLSNLVSGPASAVTARFASFNGTTGKIIQDSGFTSSSFATASHGHTTSLYSSSPQTVTSGSTLTLTLSANITVGNWLWITWGINTSVYYRSMVRMIQFNGSDHYAVLQQTLDVISGSDVIAKLSCQLGTTSTTGSYTGNQITFRNGMTQSMTGTQTASTMYVSSISRVVL